VGHKWVFSGVLLSTWAPVGDLFEITELIILVFLILVERGKSLRW
jgi:hypothetical protein